MNQSRMNDQRPTTNEDFVGRSSLVVRRIPRRARGANYALDPTHIWNEVVVQQLMLVLKTLADFSTSGGLAIVLMTLIVKSLLLPLSLKQTASMKAMQAIQPEVQALKKKIKDREKLTQATMQLYKERGINPASGCLPMVPTMVVLIGLYGALIQLAQCDPARDGTPLACDQRFEQQFLWMHHLHKPDLLFTVPDHSDQPIEISDATSPNVKKTVLAPTAPGSKRDIDDPWHPGREDPF